MSFTQRHLALYAKNGYKKTNNIVSDVVLCLKADGHEHMKEDTQYVAEFVGRKVRPFMAECRMDEFLSNISPNGCYKTGYITTEDRLYSVTNVEYNYWEAVLRAYLYELLMMELSELGITLPEPTIKELL